jgi:hypothetical protein
VRGTGATRFFSWAWGVLNPWWHVSGQTVFASVGGVNADFRGFCCSVQERRWRFPPSRLNRRAKYSRRVAIVALGGRPYQFSRIKLSVGLQELL